jgi:predicted alpha/beta-hydrolase family hydrolase
MKDYTYSYNQKSNSEELVVIVHGGGEGIESDFIQKIKNVYNKHTTLLIQMPFFDRGEEGTTTKTFDEEIKTIEDIFSTVNIEQFKKISFIGKSIGGHILLKFIYKHYLKIKKFNPSIQILGVLVDLIKFELDKPLKIRFIQGTNDKYGSIEDVIKLIKNSQSPDISLVRIEGGDHSYRDMNKKPIYQDEVIQNLETLEKLLTNKAN